MSADNDSPPNGQLPLQSFLTYRIARMQAKLNAQASRILRDIAGVTLTQWRIIVVLGDVGRNTSANLARLTAMDKGLISRNVKSLAAEKMIAVTRDHADNRALHLELTPKGRELFERTLPRMQARQKALQAYLEDEEIEVLLVACDKLEKAAEDPSV